MRYRTTLAMDKHLKTVGSNLHTYWHADIQTGTHKLTTAWVGACRSLLGAVAVLGSGTSSFCVANLASSTRAATRCFRTNGSALNTYICNISLSAVFWRHNTKNVTQHEHWTWRFAAMVFRKGKCTMQDIRAEPEEVCQTSNTCERLHIALIMQVQVQIQVRVGPSLPHRAFPQEEEWESSQGIKPCVSPTTAPNKASRNDAIQLCQTILASD